MPLAQALQPAPTMPVYFVSDPRHGARTYLASQPADPACGLIAISSEPHGSSARFIITVYPPALSDTAPPNRDPAGGF